jgi:predicted  nucleic acid-binding Zn-ribbon protein
VRRTNELEEEVRALQRAPLVRRTNELEEEVRALQRERAGSAAEIARLNEALAECRRDLDAERRVTRQMIRSASWKITRPLRAAGAFRPRRPG